MKREWNIAGDVTCRSRLGAIFPARTWLRAGLVLLGTCSSSAVFADKLPSPRNLLLGCDFVGQTLHDIPQTDKPSSPGVAFGKDRRSLFEFYKSSIGNARPESTTADDSDSLQYQAGGIEALQPTQFLVLVRARPGAREASQALLSRTINQWRKSHPGDLNNMPWPQQSTDYCSLVDCEISIVYRAKDQTTKIVHGLVGDRFLGGVLPEKLFNAIERPPYLYRIFQIDGNPTVVFNRWRKEEIEGLSGKSGQDTLIARGAWWHRIEDPYVIFPEYAEIKALSEFERDLIEGMRDSGQPPQAAINFVRKLENTWRACAKRDLLHEKHSRGFRQQNA